MTLQTIPRELLRDGAMRRIQLDPIACREVPILRAASVRVELVAADTTSDGTATFRAVLRDFARHGWRLAEVTAALSLRRTGGRSLCGGS